MATFGKLYGQANSPRVYEVLLTATYAGIDVKLIEIESASKQSSEYQAKFPHDKLPTFESDNGVVLHESGGISFYIASQQENSPLLGKNKAETAQVVQYLLFANVEIAPYVKTWIEPILGKASYNKPAHNQAVDNLKKSLTSLEKVLQKKTFLVGERITLADIAVSSALYSAFKMVLDVEFRKNYKNVTRWYVTLINQPNFKVLADASLVDVAQVWIPPKKESKKDQKKEQQPKKEKAKPAEDDAEDDAPPPPKPKSKLDLLPPSTFVLDEWKRFYSNNKTRPDAIEWFWKHFDPEGYSIWRVDYKYNEELTKIFMSSNLIGGFYNRLERARKYAFGSLLVLGEDNNSEIAGYFVIRGQEIPEEVTDAADFESYTFVKVDPKDPAVRKNFEDFIAWDGDFNGKAFGDGKIFK
ncbi:3905_t:CDS:2 [Paraglomus brasilianum]|uniref:3905_t:CDS:1 n=1 Tax=Paraglomus brasilianum TaxID=144538 RepID=A0A9N9ASA7_9GLOM|nr:3905_t:CDS:2 [Paraglomus brasilianum]